MQTETETQKQPVLVGVAVAIGCLKCPICQNMPKEPLLFPFLSYLSSITHRVQIISWTQLI